MRMRTVLPMLLGPIALMLTLDAVGANQPLNPIEHSAEGVANFEDADAIEISHGRLTLRVRQAPLAQVLSTIGSKSGIRIFLAGSTDETVTDSFRDLALDQGLQRILRTRATAFVYAAASPASTKPTLTKLDRVYVLMTGSGGSQQMQVREPGAGGGVSAGSRARSALPAPAWSTSNPNLTTHEAHIAAFSIDTEGEKATAHATAIEDEDVAVIAQPLVNKTRDAARRKQAAEMLGRVGGVDGVEPLSQAVLDDIEPAVRETAARALGSTWDESAVAVLGRALLEDEDSLVRAAAASALGETWSDAAVVPLAQALLEDPRRHVRHPR